MARAWGQALAQAWKTAPVQQRYRPRSPRRKLRRGPACSNLLMATLSIATILESLIATLSRALMQPREQPPTINEGERRSAKARNFTSGLQAGSRSRRPTRVPSCLRWRSADVLVYNSFSELTHSRPEESRMLHRVSRIRGTDVHAVDGHIGSVEDFYLDEAQWTIRYLVVNTGSWLTRHPVLISPDAVKRNWGLAGFNVALTREQVRSSPEIDPQRALSRQDEERVLGHFGHPMYWKASGRSESTPNLCSTKNVAGDHIQASDGEIGHVDDFLINEASWHVDYLVVDTSNWIGGKWVLIAPMTLKGIDWPNSKLRVGLTRDAVKQSPSID